MKAAPPLIQRRTILSRHQPPRIVRGADTGRLDLTSESAGLYAISIRLSRTFADDHEQLRCGMRIYDALYAWCQQNAHT